MFTASPRAVKSVAAPSAPTVPTYASPVWTATPTGIGPWAEACVPRHSDEELPGGGDGRRRVTWTRDAADEEPDDLIADELVDDPAVVEDRF